MESSFRIIPVQTGSRLPRSGTVSATTMACTGARTIDMPALERPFQLGMLYDCRSNTFIPGITLWDSKTLKRNTETMPKHSTTNQIITSDTMADKASALSLSGSLKASVLAGLVELGGSAAFFNDIKKSKHHARVTLQYSMTDRFEHLTMSQLGPESISYPAVFGDHTATHVVTAVLYGAQAFFVFDREVSSSENMWEIEGKMKLLVEKIPKVPGGEETSGRFQKKQESNENLYCTFYGDFCLKKNPLSYQDAMQVYAKLPDLLRSDEKQTVPVRVWLCPLSMLDPRAAQLVREIRSVLITDAERALEHLAECDVRCSDMERVKAATTFPEIQRKIREFRNLCKQCRQMFQEELASSLPAIHGGQEEEGALVKILTSMEQSPFSTNQLSEFLEKKQEEMNFIHSYLAVLEGVRVVSSQSELQAAVLGPRHRFVVSLTLTSLHTEEPYFSALNLWLRRPFMEKTSGVVSGSLPGKNPKSKQWFEDKEIRRKAQQVVKSFSDFVRVNKSNRAVLFLVASVPDKDNPGASIYLYEDGELVSTNFEPPAKPLPPLIAGISHDRVQLTLKPAPFGESVIMGYKVEYRDFGLGGWMTRNINSKQETFPVSQLYANTRYQFRYTAVTKPGLSASSEESDVVKTLPTSPPGTPAAATVESTAITLSWEAPAVIGQRVSVKEYRVQYREEVGGENPAEKDKWLEQRTGQKVELCKTDGLKPQMLYRVRVSAVCEDGALSAPSEDLCISTLPVWANLPVTSMADVEREAVEMPTLGRPFQLGMLYDCRTDAPLPDGVELISSEEDLRDIVFNPMITYVVSFTFTSLHREEPFLSGLVAWLHTADERKTWDPASASPACEESNCRLWFEHDVAQRRARVSARFFSDFVRVNKCSGKTRFLVTSVSDEDNPGASIYLYEDGELVCTNFEPPSKPLPPLIAGISHDCVQLTLKPATRGEAAVTGYRVEYRRVGQEDWTAVSVYSKQETFPVSQLCANTEYQFQYAAISKPGLSVSSVVSDAVRMLPTSPPGRPVAVYVGSSAISLSWEAPAVLGEGVSIKEYRVEYREEAGGEGPEQKDKWLERRTGRKAELCDIDGLSPGTPYRLRVSAVCAGGTMSNVSEEATISTAKVGAITTST
ncbi:hypothetical protein Y1Q_0007711 [Alligator mississippiensis]|uniref:Fibronectin type-III domain-containing protein n=1 Tax=Alligator mississippiensis TaxID=8496 RepID=A0A151N2M1_ALLMI|nr:hypothetical protein Y1Q_0007711 [Alligator mississippiensis]